MGIYYYIVLADFPEYFFHFIVGILGKYFHKSDLFQRQIFLLLIHGNQRRDRSKRYSKE